MNVIALFLFTISSLIPGVKPHQVIKAAAIQPTPWLLFDTLNLQLSEPYYDVGFYQDGIIFYNPAERNVYLTPMDRPDPENSRPLFNNKEISCSPAAISFTGDYSNGYFTNPVRNTKNQYLEKIYEISIHEDAVSDLTQISFTGDSYRYLHPAVSSDGSLMIYSSDRLPTSGGLDLFFSRKTTAGWSRPANLGETINTSGHEWFPFLDSQNNLLYSSTGLPGYGGYDIFYCPYEQGEWGAPRNLGGSINSPENEWGVSIHNGNRVALLSRTSISGSGGMAIMASLNEDAISRSEVEGDSARNISMIMLNMAEPAVQSAPPPQTEQAIEQKPLTQRQMEPESDVKTEPGELVFRVQIISSLYSNSFPTVLVDGKSYKTYEYFYMGSYRITVGEFDSVTEADAFKVQCRNSGFKQAFVAAFRGDQRETDPSVFKQ
jgi:hypothetical protein